MDEFVIDDRELLFDHIEEAEALLDRLVDAVRGPSGAAVYAVLVEYDAHRARYPRPMIGEQVVS